MPDGTAQKPSKDSTESQSVQDPSKSRPKKPRRVETPEIKLSKALSHTLRHAAEKQGIAIDAQGYVDMDVLLRHSKFKPYSFDEVRKVVNTNNKQRFSLEVKPGQSHDDSPAHWRIRANQGHSLASVVDLNLTPIVAETDIPPQVIHGTNKKAWMTIRSQGLSRMSRHHIHMAAGKPGDEGVISGMRQSATVLIHVNVPRSLQAGIEFFRSENGVILSPGNAEGFIPPEFFLSVEGVDDFKDSAAS